MSGSPTAGPHGADAWTRPARSEAEREVRHADRLADELRRLGERFHGATGVGPRDHVLDIGCGTGESTRDAGRAASAGTVTGVDLSASVLERARRLTEQAGLRNVSYVQADAQTYPFHQERYDVGISRFGTMFFPDPVAAFTNIRNALRPGARLVLMVWQAPGRNDWYTMVREAFGVEATGRAPGDATNDPFSLADPATTSGILSAAGFTDIDFAEAREPVYYGPDAGAAYEFVTSLQYVQGLFDSVDTSTAERARHRLRVALADHDTGRGVYVGSRAWIVTARRLG